MIVTKFGGTSMATAAQIRKACDIVLADKRRKIMVVSAPGKRFDDDEKITDLLIALANAALLGGDVSQKTKTLMDRLFEIISDLELNDEIACAIETDILERLAKKDKLSSERFLDLMKAAGEDSSAKIVASYLTSRGIKAKYINPFRAGMLLSSRAGNATVLPESYDRLYTLSLEDGICVFPGFFGYTKEGEVVTFSRGGSDVTGSILAAAVGAEIYENFTDVDSVFAASPKVIDNPVPIGEITYRQMRELAYAGFGIFHEAAVEPVVRARIPIHIKNTNNPTAQGTKIVFCSETGDGGAVAIAGTGGFCNLTISKFLMNSEIGFGRKLFQILEEENISFDHAPSGIDNISPILRSDQLSSEKLQTLTTRIKSELAADTIEISYDLALIVVVSQSTHATKTTAARAVTALSKQNIDTMVLNMSSNSLSVTIGVTEKELTRALKTLYYEFF